MKNKKRRLFQRMSVYVEILLLCLACSAGMLYGETGADAAVAGKLEIRTRQGIVAATARQNVPTGFLYDKVVPFCKINQYSGAADSKTLKLKQWRQIFFELRKSAVDKPPLPALASVRAAARQKYRARKVHAIGLMDLRYNALKKGVIERELLRSRQRTALAVPEFLAADFDTKSVFAAALMKAVTRRGGNITFVLDRSFYFSNREKAFVGIRLDLDDGQGSRKVALDQEISTSYSTTGEKTILLTAVEPDGSVQTSRFTLDVQTLDTPVPDETWVFESDIAYEQGKASGEAFIYLAETHQTLQQPIVLVEGFDMLNDMGWEELYGFLNAQNFLEDLRGQGYDLVLLNFDNSMDYIQRNAFLLVKLIQQVNAEKAGYSQLVVAGASMGGLVARYALAYMEQNNIPHDTRTFISFDAPQQGANIPLGIQHWLAFFAGSSASAQELLAILDNEPSPDDPDAYPSPAAKQMLVYHHLQTAAGKAGADPLQAVLYAELDALGDYPQNIRTVAFANGRGDGLGLNFVSEDQLIDYSYQSFVTGNVWAVPDSDERMIFQGKIFSTTSDISVSGTQPYDNAPGGTRDTSQQLAETDTGGNGDITTDNPHHCFVPTVSALDIETTDLFYDIADDPSILEKTPFDVIYFAVESSDVNNGNDAHMSVTSENAPWFLEAINYRGEPRDISHVIITLRVLAEIETDIEDLEDIDVNLNGKVDMGDAVWGLQGAAYLR